MPTISVFYGITVMMYFMDNHEHHTPHFHIRYGEYKASIAIDTGDMIVGDFPQNKLKLVQAWVELHREQLIANWHLACEGQPVRKIEPLT